MSRLIELSNATLFLDRCRDFLLDAEGENNLLLSSAMTLAKSPAARAPRLSFFIVEREARVVGAAMNSPDRRLLLSTSSDGSTAVDSSMATVHSAAEVFAFMGRELADRDVQVKGVLGPAANAWHFCTAFALRLGRDMKLRYLQRILRLETPNTMVLSPGRMRTATAADLPLLLQWSHQFVDECRLDECSKEVEGMVRHYIENHQLFIWDDGRPAAMAGFGGLTPNGARINMVYTEPSARRHGYAGSLVQVLSHRLLGRDRRRFCFLFTDAANPIPNRLYERLGYRAICDFAEYRDSGFKVADSGSNVRITGK